MAKRDPYLLALAATVDELFAQGKTDPSYEEIARAYYPIQILPGELIEGIRKRLIKLSNILRSDYQHTIVLTNRRYYNPDLIGIGGTNLAGLKLIINVETNMINHASPEQNLEKETPKRIDIN